MRLVYESQQTRRTAGRPHKRQVEARPHRRRPYAQSKAADSSRGSGRILRDCAESGPSALATQTTAPVLEAAGTSGPGNKRGTGRLEARTEGGVAKKLVHNGQQAPIAHHAHDGATPLRRPGRRASALAPPKLNESRRARSRSRSHGAARTERTSAHGIRRAYLRLGRRVAHRDASKLSLRRSIRDR